VKVLSEVGDVGISLAVTALHCLHGLRPHFETEHNFGRSPMAAIAPLFFIFITGSTKLM